MSHFELIASIDEEKDWTKSTEKQMEEIRQKVSILKEKATKILQALSEKTNDQSEPQEKVEVIRQLSLNLTETTTEIKELEEALYFLQTQMTEKQSSLIDKFKHSK